MPFSQNSPVNQHDQHVPAHVQPTASTPTSTIQQVSSVARNLCKEGNRDHLRMENHHHVNSCNRHCCLKARGGEYSHTLPIQVCDAQRGRDFEAPDLERGISFRANSRTGYKILAHL